MSQSGSFFDGTILPDIETLTGNAGGAVGPDGAFNINILGGGFVDVTGNPGTNTLTITVNGTLAQDFVTDSGTATPAANTLNVLGGDNMNTAGAGDTVTIHLNETIHWPNTNAGGTTGVIFLGGAGGAGGSRFLHNFSNGGTGNTFLGEDAGNLTNTSSSCTAIGTDSLISITTGPLNTAVGRGSLRSETVGDANTAIGSSALQNLVSVSDQFANNVAIGHNAGFNVTTGYSNTIIGTHAATFAGASGLTTGFANVIIGSGDINGTIQIASAGDNYVGAEQENILISNSGVAAESNTIRIGGAFTDDPTQNRCFIQGIHSINPADNDEEAVIIDSSGQLGTLSQTNGQVLIGSTGATPVAANLSAGTGIGIVNGAGTITISSSGGGLTWNEETGNSAIMVINNGYISNNAGLVTFTLPTTSAIGDIVRVTGKGTGGWLIAQNAGETIFFGTSTTTPGVGGSLASTADRDTVELVCVAANDDWNVISSIGNITVV